MNKFNYALLSLAISICYCLAATATATAETIPPSPNDGWSVVSATNNQYRITLDQIPEAKVTVLARNPEAFSVVIGTFVSGRKQAWCYSVASNELVKEKRLNCDIKTMATLSGQKVPLYVDVTPVDAQPTAPALFSCADVDSRSTCVPATNDCAQYGERNPEYQACLEAAGSKADCTYKSEKPSGCYGSFTLLEH